MSARKLRDLLLLLPFGSLVPGLVMANPVSAKPGPAARQFSDCNSGCPRMVVISPGSFSMGAAGGEEGRPEYPVHTVTIGKSFAVGAREISNAEYARFIVASGRMPSKGCHSFNPATKTIDAFPQADFRNPGPGAGDGKPDMPAVCISWSDARAYVGWLSQKTGKPYRLLSESEWEYAARAGSQAQYPWGDVAAQGCDQANLYDLDGVTKGVTAAFTTSGAAGSNAPASVACHDGFAGAAPVGSLKPNAFGLYDMIGNVWEWVEDCYVAPYPANAPTDGSPLEVTGACPRRAVRGGSWVSSPFRDRAAWRGRDPETQVSWIFGFRVARDLAPVQRNAKPKAKKRHS